MSPEYLLDSNHASPLVTPGHPLRDRVLTAVGEGSRFAIAAPCVAEVLYGIGILPRAATNLQNWALVVRDLTIYAVDADDAAVAADLQIRLRRQGRQVATVDALVAAVALRYDCVLLTTDHDFSAISGLSVENWLQSGAPGVGRR